MRTDEMVKEIYRLRGEVAWLLKDRDNYRELWRDAEDWKNRLINTMDEILCLPVGDPSCHAIARKAVSRKCDALMEVK